MAWKTRYLHPLYRYQFKESIETADNNEIHHFTSFSFSSLRLFLNYIFPKDVEVLIHSPNLRMNMVLFVNKVFVSGRVKMTSLEQAWRGWATTGRGNSEGKAHAGLLACESWVFVSCGRSLEMLADNLQQALPSRLLGTANTLVPAILFHGPSHSVSSHSTWSYFWVCQQSVAASGRYLSLDG